VDEGSGGIGSAAQEGCSWAGHHASPSTTTHARCLCRGGCEFGGGYRPLHYAAYTGRAELCQLLVQNGAKVECQFQTVFSKLDESILIPRC
jgi:hypothetical protein